MNRRILLLAACLAATHAAAAGEQPRPFDVVHYAVHVVPDLRQRQVRGGETISLRITAAGIDAIALDSGALQIDAVRESGRPLAYAVDDKRLAVRLARPARIGERHRIEIDYHGAPRSGLEFHPDRGQLYTVFSTSQWMVAVDAPGERATLDLAVELPSSFRAVGSGRASAPTALGNGATLHRWRLGRAMPSYVYGFAAGNFDQAVERRDGIVLRYLGTGIDGDGLRRAFADTGDMLRFFADRAGVAYAGGEYDQVLVADTIGQELAGMALLPEGDGRAAPRGIGVAGLVAHEAAHQWWGNRVTCADWRHFWLNEGFATFMAAAYLQHRYGEAAYRERVDGWRRRIERLRAEGKDKPLVFADWNHPSGDDRAVVYQKGAYALHLLRQRMGEDAFWDGIRAYTRAHVDGSVRTHDFERAMQRHSRDDLAPFFREWMGPG